MTESPQRRDNTIRIGSADILAESIPGARFLEFAHAGHAAPIQCAGEINELLLTHLACNE
jgi:pimeloyl-ACP methyl ester carboxylesterase